MEHVRVTARIAMMREVTKFALSLYLCVLISQQLSLQTSLFQAKGDFLAVY